MIRSVLISPIKRYFITKKMFENAEKLANEKNKRLMMIGDPCSGNYFQFMSSIFPNSNHGDVTVDLFGCEKCNKMDINDLSAWESFEDDSFVVMETGTLGYSVDLKAVLKQIKRVSGGDFLSAGGNRGLLWELLLYKTYDKKLNYSMDPFDSRKDDYYTGRKLGRKGLVKEKF
ncbi:MAG: hypothetical protein CND89_05555 [Marine Group II euryarchaeote MED-G38]|nr:hypothetical protein [Euryarchaeota archaeon]OUV27206.1 MAG: hypothetical protein CBC57_01200 [Euryarchaeota archaeon TMED97]PDH21812.1 MAG: hypothetical protein CND89_05555 [Marine Group II euryarchaeote MED-G38]|tara:strand:- start:12570 stop:13088 length:519 start_codon:yes stop_codon:yes gene_type:complete